MDAAEPVLRLLFSARSREGEMVTRRKHEQEWRCWGSMAIGFVRFRVDSICGFNRCQGDGCRKRLEEDRECREVNGGKET